MLKDNTGHVLFAGQRVTMGSDHVDWDDWEAEIIDKDGELWIRYRDDGDEVKITDELCGDIDVLKF